MGSVTLAAVLTAVSCSRLFVTSTLSQLGLTHVMDDAELVVSELVTNSVKTTGVTGPRPTWTDLRDLALITVRLVVRNEHLVIEVWDRDPRPPVMRAPTFDGESGRGLFIVAQLCDQWDCYFPPSGGKVVWAALPLRPPRGPTVPSPTQPADARWNAQPWPVPDVPRAW